MKPPQHKAAKRPNRSRGHRSPLDKLSDDARKELARRCHGDETLAQIRQWLADQHGLKISMQSISDWWKRRSAAGCESRTIVAPGFEIEITAPGAESITVRVLPSQPGEDNQHAR